METSLENWKKLKKRILAKLKKIGFFRNSRDAGQPTLGASTSTVSCDDNNNNKRKRLAGASSDDLEDRVASLKKVARVEKLKEWKEKNLYPPFMYSVPYQTNFPGNFSNSYRYRGQRPRQFGFRPRGACLFCESTSHQSNGEPRYDVPFVIVPDCEFESGFDPTQIFMRDMPAWLILKSEEIPSPANYPRMYLK
ncbi:hypothetical protein KUTeg_021842 [Tegillarca granosa]|uniref:Uncharacterized protein n=1 Tax=Tegillarca granosa TaxID=220873 RepID=A0ABQ9E4J2_TEGGR|nr:hypothetical protein KUTeg_021842 [Tegillarca granosa]